MKIKAIIKTLIVPLLPKKVGDTVELEVWQYAQWKSFLERAPEEPLLNKQVTSNKSRKKTSGRTRSISVR